MPTAAFVCLKGDSFTCHDKHILPGFWHRMKYIGSAI